MDRTSILGDAIEYMKELLNKINKLQELGSNSDLKDSLTTNQSMVRNSPKVKKKLNILFHIFHFLLCVSHTQPLKNQLLQNAP